VDTGIFADGRYFIITADYAKAAPDAYALRVTVENAGPDPATLHVLPQLWFRDMWSWGRAPDIEDAVDTAGLMITGEPGRLIATHPHLTGSLALFDGSGAEPVALLCDNETNAALLFGSENRTPYSKDGIGDHVVSGAATVNPKNVGTKGALHYVLDLAAGERREINLWLAAESATLPDHAATLAEREREADEFYAELTPSGTTADARPPWARPKRRLGPLLGPRRAADARPLGVPLVRLLGPGLPLRRDGRNRPRLREGAALHLPLAA